MTKLKKISFWIIGFCVILVALLSVLVLLADKFINQAATINRIQTEASKAINGRVELQRLTLSFFPQPHITIHQGSFSIPATVSGTLASLEIYPKILPLFTGKVQIARIDVNTPDIKVRLHKQSEPKDADLKSLSLETVEEKIGAALSLMSAKAPGLVAVVENGRLNISGEKKASLEFGDIQARIDLPEDKINVDIQCSSNLWERISVQGFLDPQNFDSNGSIELTHLRSRFIAESFLPHLDLKLAALTPFDLIIAFKTEGLKVLHGNFQGSTQSPTASPVEKEPTVKIKSFKGDIFRSEDKLRVSLDELKLVYPRLNLSGKIDLLNSPNAALRKVDLELRAIDVDVNATRKIALVRAGDIPVVKDIFDIVKGGRVPSITFTSHGKKMSDLGALENMTIKGNMQNGEIWVPVVDLVLNDVKGDVVISKGILQGNNLEASLGKTRASKGNLKLGLEGDNAPFHLDVALKADLADLPPILKRVIDNDAFQKEMALVENLKGSADGKLVLGESLDAITAKVEAAGINLSANYRRLPYALRVKNGRFSLKDDKIALENVNGNMGKSFFADLSVQFDLNKTSDLEVKTGNSTLNMEELIPWVSTFDAFKAKMKPIDTVKGIVSLSGLSLQGPLSSPENWQFQTTGKLKNLTIASSLLPDRLKVPGGNFNITSKDISVTDVQLNFPDSALMASGTITGYLKGVEKLDLKFNGNVGPKNTKWFSDQLNLPPILVLKPPVSISAGHLTWNNRQETTFSGKITLQQNLQFTADVFIKPDELRIKKLIIQDKDSHATIKFTAAKRTFDLSFVGNLTKSTLDRFISKNEILQGWVEGDFHAHLLPDQPEYSTVKGQLSIQDAVIPWKPTLPVEIHTLSLNADGTNLRIDSANLSLKNRFDLKGEVNFRPQGFLLDMEISAESLDLDQLRETLGEIEKDTHDQKIEKERTGLFQGNLKLKAAKMTYGGFTLSNFHADAFISDETARINITKADLCGISTHGTLQISPEAIQIDIYPVVENQKMDATYYCLIDKTVSIDGNFSFKGNFSARGTGGELLRSLNGHFEYNTTPGHYHSGREVQTVTKIFRLLNVTKLFQGKLPDIAQEGFGFNSMQGKADIKNGRLIMNEFSIDGNDMGIAGYGSIDLVDKQVDATLLVAPLKTVDAIVGKIPLIGNILDGHLISAPVKIHGPLDSPDVTLLSASAVGSRLSGIMKRTLQLPVQIIEPILVDEKEKDKEKN